MADRPTDGGSFPQDRYTNPETALGGADAVEKTSYVTGSGTEPEARRPVERGAPRSATSSGPNTTWIVLAFFLVAAVLVYVLGFGR